MLGFLKRLVNSLLTRRKCETYGNCKYWYLNGKPHREDGPAIEANNGHKEWWLNGKLHREDGPAAEYANGDKFWFLNGQPYRCGECLDKAK